jgi:hypothetical protein
MEPILRWQSLAAARHLLQRACRRSMSLFPLNLKQH